MKRYIFFNRIFSRRLTIIASAAFAQPMKVVASIFPVGDMVKEVGGDRVTEQVLISGPKSWLRR